MDFSGINFLAVFVAALAAFILGSLWYSPLLFGKSWQKALGFSDDYLKSGNMAVTFGFSFVLMFIMALGLALLFKGHEGNETNWVAGLWHGLFAGVVFVSTSYGINMLYQRRPFKLWAIDSAYQVIFLGMMGAIIEAW